MRKAVTLLMMTILFVDLANAQDQVLRGPTHIAKSSRIKKATYHLASNATGLLIIEGNDIVVDFQDATLIGAVRTNRPDSFMGTAIVIRNSSNITIRNLHARGYKVAIMATNVSGLTIDHCDLSYNYRQHLQSDQLKEDISDWMSYHQNEKDEWLRYGAAIYLRDCLSAIIHDCTVTGGQNALMMTACDSAMIFNNDFSFNSGIGIGMYRCSGNHVMYNRVIFNVRGYSDSVYNRGQDSAGMLVYEQSSNNLFYKNNVTHGGDGFFLWAGQQTMDSGKGGCNDNTIMNNDFSYAPTNGIEVTFSRNLIYGNRIFECDNGIWGGYSYASTISNNRFRNNRTGVAIEHGQQNRIDYNIFDNDHVAIHLWARGEQPSDWGFAKYRDTRSRDYLIAGNSFNSEGIVYDLARTRNLQIFNNRVYGGDREYRIDSTVSDIDSTINYELADSLAIDPRVVILEVDQPLDPFKGAGALAGRKNIRMSEWGPYDFRGPIIWQTNPLDSTGLLRFELLGPAGRWTVKRMRGVEQLSASKGSFPAIITARRSPGAVTDIEIELEYRGGAVVDGFGNKVAAGKPMLFRFKKFFLPIQWTVRWFAVDTTAYNPISTGQLFAPNVRAAPVKTEQTSKLDYAWWGGLKTTETFPQFLTMAEGSATIAPGEYELSVTWDDAVRVYVDNRLLIDEWNPSKYDFDESPNRVIRLKLGGNHQFRVEHVELGGFATLSLKLRRAG